MATLTLQLVAWNGAAYYPHLFASLAEQTAKDWDCIVIDNASDGAQFDALEREVAAFRARTGQEVRLIRNAENRGFARGHNQAFALSTSTFVQLLNQDVVLAPDYVARCRAFLETHVDTAAVQGALCRWVPARDERTDIVDSLGLRVHRSRQVTELGAGEAYGSVTFGEVFGVSGALPMYRRQALADVAHGDEVFDAHFFMYKEDVDLAYRLRSAGWRAYLVPAARAWHDRTAAAHIRRRDRSTRERRASYRNHLLTLLKNERWATLRPDIGPILRYELAKLAHILTAEWSTLPALLDVIRLMPAMRRRRAQIMARYRCSPEAMRAWFA